MSNLLYYFLLILIALYILSPLDAHPLFLDDLIASGVLFYLIYKNAKQKRQQQQRYSYSHNQSQKEKKSESQEPLTLDEAYRLLDVSPDVSWEEVKRAYKEKIAKSHPDKVSHLSKELQEKANELTLRLNKAYDIVKDHKKRDA